MKRLFTGPAFALALSASAFMTGCGGETPKTEQTAPPTAPTDEDAAADADATTSGGDAATEEAPTTDGAANEGLSADQVAAFASLTSAEREAVIAQKICPVSEADLGSMGPPIPVKVGDKTYYVCCEHCVEGLKEEPEKYLAKIGVKPDATTDAAEAAPTGEAAGG